MLFGRRTKTAFSRSFVIGDNTSGAALTANRTFQVTQAGNVSAKGTITPSVVFTDYAEMFENTTLGEIPTGTIVTLQGSKVRKAEKTDIILGVVSKTAAVICGDSQLHWRGMHLLDEWGALIYEDKELVKWDDFQGAPEDFDEIPEHAEFYTESCPVINPDFKPEIENKPRSERPKEWTVVGLVGQLRVRVQEDITQGEYVGADGKRSENQTPLQVMEITKPYDGNYGIALCIRV